MGLTMERYQHALTAMQEAGAEVSEVPAAEKQRWINNLPSLATQWVERNRAKGLPADEVLENLMKRLRDRGAPPMRSWDQDLK